MREGLPCELDQRRCSFCWRQHSKLRAGDRLPSALLFPVSCQHLSITRLAWYPEGKEKGENFNWFLHVWFTNYFLYEPSPLDPSILLHKLSHDATMSTHDNCVHITAVSSPKRSTTVESLWYSQALGITNTSLIDPSSNPNSPTYKISDSCYITKSVSVFTSIRGGE